MSLASEMRELTEVSKKLDIVFNEYVEENKRRIKEAATKGRHWSSFTYYDRNNKEQLIDYFTKQGFTVKTAIELGWRRYGEDSCLSTYIVW